MKAQASLPSKTKPIFRAIDILVGSSAIVLCSPLFAMSFIRSHFKNESFLRKEIALDALHRPVHQLYLRHSRYSACGLFLSVLKGHMSLFGIDRLPQNCVLERPFKGLNTDTRYCPAGILSLANTHRNIGLIAANKSLSIPLQLKSLEGVNYFTSLLKALLTQCLFSSEALNERESFYLFGLRINNHSMDEALEWLASKPSKTCQTAVFVNVNSVNQALEDCLLKSAINSADKIFADGSGVRMGARKLGVALKANVNGTDLLPLLCERAQVDGLSIFLLGSRPGVANLAAKKLQQTYPGLTIAGTHHGYIEPNEDPTRANSVVDIVNRSKADILLLGLGSPIQEQWLIAHRKHLQCSKALAVGGLFDYFSGNVPRAPLFFREIGMEWLWRLFQQPAQKWQRYVIGNPLYLLRLLRLKRNQ